jgi:hypothetical protein
VDAPSFCDFKISGVVGVNVVDYWHFVYSGSDDEPLQGFEDVLYVLNFKRSRKISFCTSTRMTTGLLIKKSRSNKR